MTKVWVLEKYITVEEMNKHLAMSIELLETTKEKDGSEEAITLCEDMIRKQEEKIKKNPNGYWLGWEGKSIYKQFCNVAKAAINRAEKGTQFRVVEGEIKDDAKYWLGYKIVKVNDGVLRYLMATR